MGFVLLTIIQCVLFISCATATNSIPGGLSTVPVDDAHVQDTGKFIESKLNEAASDDKKVAVANIVKAESQVVSGRKLILTLDLIEGKKIQKQCVISVWEQPWLNKREITGVNCTDGVSIEKRRRKKSTLITEKFYDRHLPMFKKFVMKFDKNYADQDEFNMRYSIFRDNLNIIRNLNKTEQGTARYGVTYFADFTPTEFKKHLGLKVPENPPELPHAVIPSITLPPEFDWRHYNVVTPVKNQGSCGSCWAFSVTGNIEGQWALRNGQLYSLSEQEIVDCDKDDEGCNGGYMTTAYNSIQKIGGLETEKDYPYEAENEDCHFNSSEVKVTISGGVNITSNETGMAQWLVKNGPMSVGLNAMAMQFYLGGVSHPFKALCSPDSIDHGVLIVGYGVHTSKILKKTLPYWTIKNSWGKRWGELGYYRLYRGDGSCGINQMVSSAVL